MNRFPVRIFAVVLLIGAIGIFGLVQNADHATAKPDIYVSGAKEFGAELAVGGYDAVAYQTTSQAMPGQSAFATTWNGATWQFSSAENLAAFKLNPERYAPQYGGYCAYGVSYGAAVHGDPRQWSVVDGKLYLNFDASVKAKWSASESDYIAKANANWPNVLEK